MVVTGAINLCQFVTKLILEKKFEIFQKIFFFVKIKFWKFNFRNRSKLNRNNSFKMTLDRREVGDHLDSDRQENMTHQIWLMRKCYKYYIFNVTRVTYKNLIVKQWFGLESGSKWLTVVCEMNQFIKVKWLDLVKEKKVPKVQIEIWSFWSMSVPGLGRRLRQRSGC